MAIVTRRRALGRPTSTHFGAGRRAAALAAVVLCLAAAAWVFAKGRAAPPGTPQVRSEGGDAARTEVAAPPRVEGGGAPPPPAPAPGPAGAALQAAPSTESAPAEPAPAPAKPLSQNAADDAPAPGGRPGHERPKRVFSSPAEQMISGFASARPGYPPPIMMRFPTGASVQEILDTPIEIYDDDDEATVALKENCARMKEEIKAYIADGGTAENFLLWYHNELSKDYEDWQSSQRRVVELLKEGALEEAERLAEEVNSDFAARGVRQVALPPKLVERITGK